MFSDAAATALVDAGTYSGTASTAAQRTASDAAMMPKNLSVLARTVQTNISASGCVTFHPSLCLTDEK